MKLLTADEINAAYAQVEAVDEGRVGPDRANYLALSDADFELLLHSIYKERKLPSAWYSNVRLMVTGADQGRDVWLTKDERPVGLIQCKKVKAGFTRPDTLREVIKFLLNVVLEPALMQGFYPVISHFMTWRECLALRVSLALSGKVNASAGWDSVKVVVRGGSGKADQGLAR